MRDDAEDLQRAAHLDVLVVDDHRTFGDAMRIAIDLEPGLRCSGSVASFDEALDLIDRHGCPDAILLDVGLPGVDGIAAIGPLRVLCRDAKVILITADTSAETLIAAVDAGAHGYLPKSFPVTTVLRFLHDMDDHLVAEPLTLSRALQHATRGSADPASGVHELTEREYEILLLLADGISVKQIASRRHMSVHTCRGHIASILRKFGVHSQLAAVVTAAQLGMLPNLRGVDDVNPQF